MKYSKAKLFILFKYFHALMNNAQAAKQSVGANKNEINVKLKNYVV